MKPAVSFCVSLVAGACALAAAIYPSMSVAARGGEAPARTTVVPATDASSVSAAASAASAGIAGKLAAAPLASASSAAVGGSSAATSAGALRLPFSMLGAYQTLALRGLDDTRTVNVGVRLDRVVTAATLRLRYTYSPSLVFPMSHIKVSVNGESVATVPLEREQAGQAVTRDIVLDPRFFTDYNQLNLNLIAHYTLDHCEDPQNSALWADVSPTSELILQTSAVRLPNDLALLPAPFFDRRDVSRLRLPFLLPANPDNETVRSAGVLASWFGMLADYRQARFPVVSGLPADSHGVVIGVASSLPAQLKLPAPAGPTLMVVDNPAAQDKKLLVVTGRDAAEVERAVDALVLGRAALSGPATTVAHIDIGEPRKPYDAPRWVPVDRPVTFKELVDDPAQLQVSGSNPDAIRVNLRVPADLFSWSGTGVPLDLHYRYTAPTVVNNSALAVNINDQLVKSLRLPKASAEDGQGRMQLPVLSDQPSHSTNSIDIPAFRVGSSNQLQLRFNLDSQKTGLCQGVAANPVQAAVDPDSTIDFSHFVHYAQMPNLAFFANSGFPFTRYADLSQTAVVIPPHAGAEELEAFLTMMGHMGQWTGYPSLRVQVIRPAAVASLAQTKDMLFVGGSPGVLAQTPWQAALPLTLGALQGAAGGAGGSGAPSGTVRASFSVKEHWRNGAPVAGGSAQLEQDGALAALFGFQQPGTKGRSVVVMQATSPAHLSDMLDVFERGDSVSRLQGDLALVRDGQIDSLRVGETYLVGYVPWYARIWSSAIRHPVVLGLLGALGGLLLAIGAFVALQELAARRRGL
ncbi:cellulose biosynthesis cyclic di-GMP-binding regulatory protein BcsB [Paraburkholderia graminis]|uniref:cellulose biosynthesis cyclic di-GMP-binding regulatory protein BcsB n=1 Tax=Paraburkholderia graminis TaxID=60548 RepID=UPI000DEFEC84|nr:cellulose biosynthesis cyclic di-GMP-binding regulatory protein BcsB [Paraburkholderia graminis]AXF07093.1 cellulose biosynthesis cyclic di-GMP-binding regulatory protein BcsB [Paraburkholderia graminis]MDR6468627.1 hypothetical protein [Paraburkholderia graminis]